MPRRKPIPPSPPPPVSAELFTPVTADLPPAPSPLVTGLSRDESWRRETRAKAQRARASPQSGSGRGKRPSPRLTVEEAHGIVADIARTNHQIAQDPTATGSDRKNSAVAAAVSMDKFVVLTKHGSEVNGPETRKTSPELLALAERLILGGLPTPSPPPDPSTP